MPKIDHIKRCLGKLPAREDPRRMMFASYRNAELPPPPPECDRTYGYLDWGILGNHRAGCCAYAAVAHHGQAWSLGTTGDAIQITEHQVLQAYSEGTGYDPHTGANDFGANMIEVQEHWRTVGFGTNKIVAYAGVDLRDPQNTKEAIYHYGGAYSGVQLPQTAMQQTEAGLTWTVPYFSSMLGGHAITILSYTSTHLWCVTWGQIQAMTWEFYMKYADESYAVINPLWILPDGQSPSGLSVDRLVQDLAAVASGPGGPPVA